MSNQEGVFVGHYIVPLKIMKKLSYLLYLYFLRFLSSCPLIWRLIFLWYPSIYLCRRQPCVKFTSFWSSSIFFIQTFIGLPLGLVPVPSISTASPSTHASLHFFTCPNHLSLLSRRTRSRGFTPVAAFQLEPGVGKSSDAVANCLLLASFFLYYALKFQKPGVGS